MKALVVFAALAMSLQCLPASADCTLAFAPPAVRHAASEHYYRSSRRDSIPPGHLPAADRQQEVRETGNDADNAYRNKMGLSPELYLARQLAEIQAEACKAAAACYLVPQGRNVVVK